MRFVAIDFETANDRRDSACAVAIAVVEGGIPLRTHTWSIRPEPLEFNPLHTSIHGISEDDVRDSPLFPVVWDELRHHVSGKLLLAHNAGFDMSVLRHLLQKYDLDHPTIPYFCTRALSRAAFPGTISYTLEVMAERLNVGYVHRHDPAEDAAVCAEVALRCCDALGSPSIESALDSLSITCGELFPGGYRSWRYPTVSGPHPRDLVPESSNLDPAHPFYGKSVVFTGALYSMLRASAMQAVVNVGGECGLSVTKRTNFLVVGERDFRKFRGGDKSSKMSKAEQLLATGVDIEILPEPEFMKLL